MNFIYKADKILKIEKKFIKMIMNCELERTIYYNNNFNENFKMKNLLLFVDILIQCWETQEQYEMKLMKLTNIEIDQIRFEYGVGSKNILAY